MREDIPHSYLKPLIQDKDSHQPITNSKEQKQERKINIDWSGLRLQRMRNGPGGKKVSEMTV
jgi:hypothetical protein